MLYKLVVITMFSILLANLGGGWVFIVIASLSCAMFLIMSIISFIKWVIGGKHG